TNITRCSTGGIRIGLGAFGTGTPTITGCNVNENGVNATSGSYYLGNGVTLRTADGSTLNPVLGTTNIRANRRNGLVLMAVPTNTGPSCSIGGSVTGCDISSSGLVGTSGDGVQLRASGSPPLPPPNPPGPPRGAGTITTSFDSNNIYENFDDGFVVFAYGFGVDGPEYFSFPAVAPTVTNTRIHHNGGDGMDVSISTTNTPAAADLSPLLSHGTIAYNPGSGIRQGPIDPPVFPTYPPTPPSPSTRVQNSVVRYNTVADMTAVDEQAQVFNTNFVGGLFPPPNGNNGSAVPTPIFVAGSSGDFHLFQHPNCAALIDNAPIAAAGATTIDFEGQSRPFNFLPACSPDFDRGADEVH
ncbi:MAG: hypothetical protein ACREIU_01930, partial [Planctomycetota bacterium]